MKQIFSPHHGHSLIIGGRRRRISKGPRVRLASYLDMKALPPAPDCNYTPKAQGLGDVLANDRLGDCTCAGVGHIIDLVTGAADSPVRVSEEQIIALYEAACGYNPNCPSSDQGGDEYSVLDYMCEKGLDGAGLHKFDASVLVDGTNKEEVRAAMWLFGNLYFGVGLPDAWLSPFPSGPGFTWGVAGAADENNGHCFVGVGSSTSGVEIDTWGLLGTITYDAIAAYASDKGGGELHTVLTCDWFSRATQLAPSGFAYKDLAADLIALGHGQLQSAA